MHLYIFDAFYKMKMFIIHQMHNSEVDYEDCIDL